MDGEHVQLAHACLKKSRPARGMTLIEIMVVITLLGLIAAAVGVSAMKVNDRAHEDLARQQAMELARAMDSYKVMYGRYPSTSEGLQVLVKPPHGRSVMDRLPRDPWGVDYVYVIPGVMNPNAFDIRSHGPDRVEGGGDDVGNWPADAQRP